METKKEQKRLDKLEKLIDAISTFSALCTRVEFREMEIVRTNEFNRRFLLISKESFITTLFPFEEIGAIKKLGGMVCISNDTKNKRFTIDIWI